MFSFLNQSPKDQFDLINNEKLKEKLLCQKKKSKIKVLGNSPNQIKRPNKKNSRKKFKSSPKKKKKNPKVTVRNKKIKDQENIARCDYQSSKICLGKLTKHNKNEIVLFGQSYETTFETKDTNQRRTRRKNKKKKKKKKKKKNQKKTKKGLKQKT
ncbi:hypothetical protein M0813_15972 [Anaeramoeba flamelloides]|uniref:Uncharacterized protein n=1 Tax=Anaeramoeba flamelloides TaxID=1746091 RepID=A0ABQ8Z0U1_9EUKA|nr:hypothetical protein M0813_15972 [Anaeramoeba flamelloides]